MQRQIKLKQVQCIIDIILSSDHFSDEEFYNRMGSFPLSQSVKARHIRFLGHCLQHPQEDHISKYALYHPKHCKGRPGGCKIVFHKYAAKLINPENPPPPPSPVPLEILWYNMTAKLGSTWRLIVGTTQVGTPMNASAE